MNVLYFLIMVFLLGVFLYLFFPVSTDPIKIFNISEEKENRNIKIRIILGIILFIFVMIVFVKFYLNG